MAPIVEAPIHLPWPAGRPRSRRPPRRRPRGDVRLAGISAWGWTLFCIALSILAWRLPCFESASGFISGRELDLPSADHGSDLELAPTLSIDARVVLLDGRRMATTDDVRQRGVDALEQLEVDLETIHRNWSIIHPRDPYTGTILVMAPADTDWAVLRPVLLAAANAGCPSPRFVVRSPVPEPPFEWSRFEER